jgi:hypothetical protein
MKFEHFKLAKEKKLENEAWEKLKAYFPDSYVSLDCDRERYETMNEKIRFHAYVCIKVDQRSFMGDEFESPMDAVNNLIHKKVDVDEEIRKEFF